MRIRILYTASDGKTRTLAHKVNDYGAADVYAKRNCRSNETYEITIVSNLSTNEEIIKFWSD